MVPADDVVVVVDVVESAGVCATAALAVNSIAPKMARLLRLRILFFIWMLSC
jgi:hypothetical protein